MIVPAHYIELLNKRDTFGYLASINEKQLCDVCRSNGVYVKDQEFLKIIYMPELSPGVLQNLQVNPQMTVTIVSAFTFECYQFKGNYISHENIGIEDEKFKDTYLRGMVEVIGEIGFNMEKVLKEKYVKLHAEAIIMKIEEIYDQTPKKGTGNLVEPLNQIV